MDLWKKHSADAEFEDHRVDGSLPGSCHRDRDGSGCDRRVLTARKFAHGFLGKGTDVVTSAPYPVSGPRRPQRGNDRDECDDFPTTVRTSKGSIE